MQKIRDIARNIEEELNDACKYAQLALDSKKDDPDLSETFYELSKEEMEHAMKLHEQVVRIIDNYRKTNGDPPERMQGRYDYMHEQYMEKAAKVKGMIAVYDMR